MEEPAQSENIDAHYAYEQGFSAETEAETKAVIELDSEDEEETETESQTEISVETEVETELETEVETESETEVETESETESEIEIQTESETEIETETESETQYPAQRFTASEDGVLIIVNAPESAFPEGTTMTVSHVDDEQTLKGIEEAAQTDEKLISRIEAVDICFRDADGNEIEPKAPVSVCMITENKASKEDPVVVHVDDDGHAETVQDAEVYTTGTHDQIVLTANGSAANQAEAETEAATEAIDESSAAAAKTAIEFETEQFSIYAVVYTVDFHWEVDGKEFTFSIPGGGFVSLEHVVEMLGITETDTDSSSDAENAEAVKLNETVVSETARKFVADVEGVEFSDPELVWVGKIDEATTVGEIKEAHGLECEYSAELTEEQIAEINSSTVEADDWALISVRPFTSEEMLTVTMKNGEVFSILVTDAQISKDFLSASGETYTITVTYDDLAEIPENSDLNVREIEAESEAYAKYLTDSAQILGVEGGEVNFARFFDIEIVDVNGEKVEPKAPVQVSIQYKDPMEIDDNAKLSVVHFAEKGTEVIQDIKIEDENYTLTYVQESFSVTGTIINTPGDEHHRPGAGQYMVLVNYPNNSDNYYIVNNDGSLTKVNLNFPHQKWACTLKTQ